MRTRFVVIGLESCLCTHLHTCEIGLPPLLEEAIFGISDLMDFQTHN